MQPVPRPRVVVAGLSGDAGKTLVSLGLALAARRAGLDVRGFKKGPDYIDAAWLSWATGHAARNLDTFLMGFDGAAASAAAHGCADGLNVIEGNRGLFDGGDPQGAHSTAALARRLAAPVLLVVNAAKTTRTAAACVLGCQKLDPDLHFAGVVLNPVGTARHEQALRDAVESICCIPVLGAVRRLPESPLPLRHLGLVTPTEHADTAGLERRLLEDVAPGLDLERILACARAACPLPAADAPAAPRPRRVVVGCIRDRAFTFYYPDNLEALEAAGATLAAIDSLSAHDLPAELDALYIGGGFPETHADALAANPAFLRALAAAARRGLPIYAECGGLMLLSRAIWSGGVARPMAGVLPFEVEVCPTPRGHGYVSAAVDRENPFFPVGLRFQAHEFHYSQVRPGGPPPPTACALERGTGCFDGRDGVCVGSVWASYSHIHAGGVPEWADGVVEAAARFRRASS